MSKQFLTYNRQMKHLRDQKKIVCSGTGDKTMLVASGYFNLVNGYKIPFCVGKDSNGNHRYLSGTSLQEMYGLKTFDDELRMLLFKYTTIVEQEVGVLAAYTFDNTNISNSMKWYSVDAYDTQHTTDVVRTISNLYYDVKQSTQKYVENCLENHNSIPTWVMIKVIRFGNLIDFIEFNKPIVKDNLCNMYSIKDATGNNDHILLIGSLHWLRKIRNACAHNERVFDLMQPKKHIVSPYFDLMALSYNNGRDRKIIDALVYFKYYLPHEKFEELIIGIKGLLVVLNQKIRHQAFERVRAALGIRDVTHLDALLAQKKQIYYHKHS